MTAPSSIDLSGWLSEQLGQASPDLLRQMITTFVQALMGAEADADCGAPFGVRSDERTNIRNGYRHREWDTRAGTIDVAIPKLRSGSYFPDWLLEVQILLAEVSDALPDRQSAGDVYFGPTTDPGSARDWLTARQRRLRPIIG